MVYAIHTILWRTIQNDNIYNRVRVLKKSYTKFNPFKEISKTNIYVRLSKIRLTRLVSSVDWLCNLTKLPIRFSEFYLMSRRSTNRVFISIDFGKTFSMTVLVLYRFTCDSELWLLSPFHSILDLFYLTFSPFDTFIRSLHLFFSFTRHQMLFFRFALIHVPDID